MNKKSTYVTIIVFLAAIIIGFGAFLFWVAPFLFAESTRQADAFLKQLVTASLLKYGTVTAIDPANHTITVRVKSSFEGTPDAAFLVHVDPAAYIAHEELIAGPDGTYTGIPTPTVASLSDILPGNRVAILFAHRADNAIITSYILFGNPL